MSGNVDTFENDEVIEEAPASTGDTSGMDTFDSPTPVESKEEVGDKQIQALDDQEDKEKEEKPKEKDGEEPKEPKEESKEDGDGDDKSPTEGDKSDAPKVKMLKGKLGDEKYEINPDVAVKVKVDGKKEEVSVQELINNYSGQKKWDQEFTKLSEEKKSFQKENDQYKQELGWLQNNIKEITGILDDPDRNPVDALMYLVDSTNRNPVEFQMKLLNHMQSEVENLSEMDEIEQELYWERQKTNYLSKRQESMSNQAKSDLEIRELKAKIDAQREALGVEEEQFMEAHSELEELGYKDVTPEQAINYAVIKPHLDAAEDLIRPFEEEMTTEGADKLITDFANYLKSGEFTKEELHSILQEEYASDSEIQDLKDKVKDFKVASTGNNSKVAAKEGDYVESFDDFDEYAGGSRF